MPIQIYIPRLAGQSYPVENGLVHCLFLTCSSRMLIGCMTSLYVTVPTKRALNVWVIKINLIT